MTDSMEFRQRVENIADRNKLQYSQLSVEDEENQIPNMNHEQYIEEEYIEGYTPNPEQEEEEDDDDEVDSDLVDEETERDQK